MTKVWKVVLIVALVLLVFGLLLAGVGLLTGASTERITATFSDQWSSGVGAAVSQALSDLLG